MRKLYPLVVLALLCSTSLFAQLTGTKNIPGDYADLAAAITDLNTAGVGPGGVTLNLVAGNPQTAPAGGYNITATGISGNPIIITGNGNTVTAGLQAAASAPNGFLDAVFKIAGGDYITIQGFTMLENGANVVVTSATNTMTEFGVLLIHASATDGCQNNTIQNNTITLNSTYVNSVGIFSTSSSSTANASQDATSTAGTNSNNKIYTNTISAAYGIWFICPPVTATVFETGNDIGGSLLATGNNITFGNAAANAFGWNRATTTLQAGIVFRNGTGNSIRFNTVTSNSAAYVGSAGVNGIVISSGTAPTGVTYTATISDNTVVLTTTGVALANGIDFGHGISTGTIAGSNNNITINQTSGAANSAALIGVKANYASAINTVTGNTVVINQSNSAAATTSAVTGITCNGLSAGNLINANNNIITVKQAVSGAGSFGAGAITYLDITPGTQNTQVVNATGNTFNTTGSTIRSTGTLIVINPNSTVGLYNIKGNTAVIDRNAASGSVFFTQQTGTPSNVADTVSNNNITFTGLSGSTIVNGISQLGGPTGAGQKSIANNVINITGTNTGTSKGIAWGYSVGTNGTQMKGNSITINNAATTLIGLDGSGTSAAANNLSGNTISLTSSATAPTSMIGINGAATGPYIISNNTITAMNFTGIVTTGPTVSGIAVSVGTGNVISGNTVANISMGAATSSGSPTIDGILVSGGTSTTVSQNKIYGITTAATGTTTIVNGIRLSAGTTNTVQNNLIGDLTTPAAASTDAIRGISITSTATSSTNNVYYNTVYLAASSTGANFGTTGVYHAASTTATTAVLNLRNNIIINNSSRAGTGFTVVLRRSSGTAGMLANYASTSNNNLLYTTPNTANYFFYHDGTGSAQNLLAYKNGVFTAGTIAARDNQSVSENPPFLSTTGTDPNFLHINTTIATQVESGAAPLAGITTDFDGDTRNATLPDIGADEGAFIFLDLSGPAISYTALSNTLCTTGRLLTATITDVSGVNTTAGTKPRLYYKRSGDANTYNDNTSGTDGWKYVEASNAVSPFTFTADLSLLNGGTGLASGQTLQYFVVAQDNVGTPNVGIYSGTFAASPTSVALTAAAFPVGGTISSYTVSSGLGSDVTIGAAGTYTTLTGPGGLFATINSGGLSNNITASIIDPSITETGANALNNITYGCGTYTLTIKPGAGVNATLTGSVGTGAVIKLNGADNVVIDGSNNGTTSRNLTIQNTTATTSGNAVIWLAAPASGDGSNNNIIKNCIIEGNAATTTFLGMYIGGSATITLTAAGLENNNSNTINNNLFRKTQYGLAMFGYAAASPDINNIVSGNNFGTAIAGEGFNLEGIHTDRQSNLVISDNDVQNIRSTSTTTLYGIRLLDFKNGQAYRNKVHNISYTGASTGRVYGFSVVSSTYGTAGNPSNAVVYNNAVYDITSSGTNATWNLTGMLAGQSYGDRYYYNTVHLAGQLNASASGLSAAFANGDPANTTPATNIDVKNNIFNLVGTSSGGNVWAYYSQLTSFTGSAQNYNVIRSAGTGATNNTGRFNGVNYTSLATWRTATGVDANSTEADPVINSATNAKPQPGSSALNAGTPLPGYTTDIVGIVRSLTTPTIGAYETAADESGPAITFTALSNTLCATSRTITATITDGTGVNTTAGTKPRIWFKKSTNANVLPGTNDNTTDGWKYAEATNASSPFSFTIDYSLISGGVAGGDIVQYFFAAQDVTPGQYVTVAGGTITGTATSVALAPGNFPVTSPTSYTVTAGGLSSDVTIGATGTYTTLTGAANSLFAAINTAGGLTNNVTATILDPAVTETGATALNAMTYGCAGSYTLTIKPAPGISPVLSGTNATTLIDINGADNVILDGSNNGTASRDMTIRNTNTSGAVIRFINDATSNTVKNTVLEGVSTSTSNGVITFSTSTGTLGNSTNTIDNNIIRSGATAAAILVYASGSSTAVNRTNTINNNELANWTANAVNITSTGTGDGWVLSNNKLYQTAPRTTALTGITISTASGHLISNNSIGGSAVDRSGAALTTTSTFNGILLAVGNSSYTSVQGNTISNLNISGGSTQTSQGISITSGSVNIGTVAGNTIGGGAAAYDTIRFNYDNRGIYYTGADFVNIENNVVGNIAYYNGVNDEMKGIRVNSGIATIRNNVVRDMKHNGDNGTSFFITGIQLSAATTGNLVEGNQVYNLNQFNGTGPCFNIGIYVTASTSATVRKNKVYNLTGSYVAHNIFGIYANGGSASYENNFVSLDPTGINHFVVGLRDGAATGTNTWYYNSVRIGGDGATGTNATAAFNRSSTATTTVMNNILSNTRTNGGANIAIWNSASATGFTSNYNDLYSAGPGVGAWTAGTVLDFATWKTTSSGDVNSKNVLPNFTSSTDLHLATDNNCALDGAATPISVTTDIDGETRNATTPDIGADEFTNTFNLTITNPATVCSSTTVDITAAAVTSGSTSGDPLTYWTDLAATSALATPAAVNASGTYYIKLTKGSCSSVKPVVVTLDPVTVGGSVAGTQTICSGTQPTTDLVLSGHTGAVQGWQASPNNGFGIVSPIASTSTTLTGAVIGNLTQNTYFRAVLKSGVCNVDYSAPVLVTVNPVSVGGTVAGTQTICAGTQPGTDLVLSGNTGTIVKWQKASDAAFTSPTDIVSVSATLTGAVIGNLSATTYFRAVVQSGVCASANSASVLVTVDPVAVGGTVSGTQSVCTGNQPGTNLVLSGHTGTVVKWQKASDAAFTSPTDIVSTSTTLTGAVIGNLSASTYFRAVVQSGVCVATANSASVLISVDPVSVGGTVSGTQTICSGTQPSTNLVLSGNTGGVTKWQKSTDAAFTSPTDIASTSATLTGAVIGNLSATTYFRAVVQSGVCGSANSASVLVTVDPVSVGGTVSGTQTICAGTQPGTSLVLSGNTGSVVKWQKASDAAFTSPTDIVSTSATLTGAVIGNLSATTYFRAVVQSGVCGSANSASVLVTVSPTTVAGTVSGTQTICIGNAPLSDLTLSGNTGSVVKWQKASDAAFTSPTDIVSTSTTLTSATIGAINSNTYFRAVVQSGVCAASNSNGVLIGVNTTVNNATALAGVAGGASVCANYDVATSNSYLNNCDLIATVAPIAPSPVSGNVNACVKIDASVQTATTGEPYVQRHFNILPASNATTATSTITLYFTQAEFNAFNAARGFYAALPTAAGDAAGIANLRVTQYNGIGTAPGNYSGTAVQINPADASITYNATAGRWSVSFDVTGSGGFYVHTGKFTLPVTLLEFKGQQAGDINKLSWKTATEANNRGFELERSADGSDFSSLGFVATKAVNGNSTSALNYSYDDARPLQGNNYYRLKQIDRDGKNSYSQTIMLSRKVTDITLTSVYPNPTIRVLNLAITSPKAEKVTLIVTDLSGKVLMQQPMQLVTGENLQKLDVLRLAAGTYFIKAVCANGCETTVQRFVKQ